MTRRGGLVAESVVVGIGAALGWALAELPWRTADRLRRLADHQADELAELRAELLLAGPVVTPRVPTDVWIHVNGEPGPRLLARFPGDGEGPAR